VNTAYGEVNYIGLARTKIASKIKYEVYHQREPVPVLRDNSTFLGAVNRLDYVLPLSKWNVRPRLKSLYKYTTPQQSGARKAHELSEIASLLLDRSFVDSAHLTLGLEYTQFHDLRRGGDGVRGAGDFRGIVYAMQFSNTSSYQGYRLTANVGFRSQTRYLGNDVVKTSNLAFVQVVAGMGER
jgi:hypothetical protein